MTPYNVKYTAFGYQDKLPGERYGTVRSAGLSAEAKKADERGEYIIEDYILPLAVTVPKSKVQEVGWDELYSEVEAWMQADEAEARKIADANLDKDEICVGDIFHVGVADGTATYVVTKVNKNTVKVEWRGWGNFDQYVADFIGHGGTLRKDQVAEKIAWAKCVRKMSLEREREPAGTV